MSVGGRVVEIGPHVLRDADNSGYHRNVIRLWIVDGADETIVYAEPNVEMPRLGENVWWQSGKIMFDQDRQHLVKVGYSHSAN